MRIFNTLFSYLIISIGRQDNDTNDIYGFQNMSNNISYEYIIDNLDNNIQRATCKEEIPSIEHAMNIRNSIINILNDNHLRYRCILTGLRIYRVII